MQGPSEDSTSLQSSSELDIKTLFSNVLLIEDEEAHARLIERALQNHVGEIQHVKSAEDGIARLTDTFTDLVLCDLNLIGESGLDFIAKAHAIRPRLPIIVLTSSQNLDCAVRAMREGAWDFVVKKFSEDLSEQLSHAIKRAAKRCLREVQEVKVRTERDAFSVAAFTAQDGLAILSDKGRVIFANEAFGAFSKLMGVTIKDVSGIDLVEMISRQDSSAAKQLQLELSKETGASLWRSELLVAPKAGADEDKQPHYYELSLSSASASQLGDFGLHSEIASKLRSNVMWIRDISRKKDQERFQRDLLSTTTHDLKGPLGAILTSAELLSDGKFSSTEKGLDILTRIASCARNSISIIDELLSARRIQDGVLVVKPRWYKMDEVLEDIVLDYYPMAKAKDIVFQSSPVDESLQIFADRLGLARVLGNLVSNSLKFTPKGGRVELSATKVRSGVRISVSDTGPGIEASERHKLFGPFSRLDKHSEIEGTGLGLYVTKNIVDAHNGRIEVKSEVGAGTTFMVTFPDES